MISDTKQSVQNRRPLICVLDDDPAVCDSLRILLTRNDFSVVTYASPNDLLTSPGLDGFDCLLVDQGLPVMSGLEVLEILRTRAYLKPALLMWAAPASQLLQRIQRVGVTSVLQKPIASDALLYALRDALRT